MNTAIVQPMAESFAAEHGKKQRRQKILTVLAAIVVFFTTYALILPAITWEKTLVCELPEHVHTDECWEETVIPGDLTLICEHEEHAHTDECYQEISRTLVCELEETEGHVHGDECYLESRTLVCDIPEHEGHTHTENCWTERSELICTCEECAAHVHSENCYDENGALICGLEETEGHAHGADCYRVTRELTCGTEECEGHVHTDACYEIERTLICETEEHEGHVHTDACYEIERVLLCECEEHSHAGECYTGSPERTERTLICGMEEHVHTDPCFDAPPAEDEGEDAGYLCEMIEHVHSEECYSESGMLTCTIPEHVHSEECLSCLEEDEDISVCELAEHLHGEECYSEDGELICTIPEHVHTEECGVLSEILDEEVPGAELPDDEYALRSVNGDETTLRYFGEDFRVTVCYTTEAAIPEEAVLSVRELDPSSDEFDYYFSEMVSPAEAATIKFCRLFDISFLVNGAEVEPEAPVVVNITYDEELPTIEEGDNFQTIHFAESGAETLDVDVGSDSLTFTQNSFSVTGTTLTSTTAVQGTYYKRVTGFSEFNTSDQYLIVSAEGSYALRGNDTNYRAVDVVPVPGNSGYFTVTPTTDSSIGNAAYWVFNSITSSSKQGKLNSVGGTKYYLRLNDSSILVNNGNYGRNVVLTYDSNSQTWTLKNTDSSYYLWNGGGAFSRSNSTSNTYQRNVLILKMTDTILEIPDEDAFAASSVSTDDGADKPQPKYGDYLDPSGAKSGTGVAYGGEDSGITLDYASDAATSDIERDFSAVGSYPMGNAAEGYENLFDGKTNTKYCVNPEDGKVTVVFETDQAYSVSKYTLTTANDTATYGRLPTKWVLYGSNDEHLKDSSWVVLDTVTSGGLAQENYSSKSFHMDRTGSYRYFKIVFETSSMIQLSELSLSGVAQEHVTAVSGAGNDGKVSVDKSVIYMGDDYGAFKSYDEATFGVTLSALGQNYQLRETAQINIPVDVVFVLDTSGSMGKSAGDVTRTQAVVDAVNSAMTTIMGANSANRAGIVLFSSGGSVLLPLDHYSSTSTYVTNNDGKIRTSYYLKNGKGTTVTQTYGETNGFTQGNGTYTQYGVALGGEMLLENASTTYDATIFAGTSYEKTVTVTRQPVIILLSDGDPTLCTPNYTDVLSGPAYGSGVYNNTTNNKGVHGYYTILSANYYKRMVSNHYNAVTLFYTVGMGINATGYADLSASSVTGDHYKRAVLDPSSANVDYLRSATGSSVLNKSTTAYQLSDLLKNSSTISGSSNSNHYVTVETTSKYSEAIGVTSADVPLLRNPYSEYDYADKSYFGNLTTTDLQDAFDQIIAASAKVKNYGYMLRRGSAVEITDTIGAGMEIKGVPVLRYNGRNYTLTKKSESNGTVTYTGTGKAYTTDGSGTGGSQRSADLSKIEVVVKTTAPDQTVTLRVPETELPAYTPDNDADWYYEQLPVRLIYQVGLTDTAAAAVSALGEGESLTYYANAWQGGKSAGATQQPHEDNPYYCDQLSGSTVLTRRYQDGSENKTENTTGTAATVAVSTGTTGTVTQSGKTLTQNTTVTTKLGNNGKLVFHGSGETEPPEEPDDPTDPTGPIDPNKAPDHSKRIDAFRDGANNPDTDLDDNAADLTDLYRIYLDVGPETAYEALDVLFIIDRSTSMSQDYSWSGGENGQDATDILGGNPVWRRQALNGLLNGLAAKGQNDPTPSKLVDNGLISNIMELNRENRVAVGWFANEAGEVYTWQAGRTVTDNRSESGTNYVAALIQAKKQLELVKNDGRKHVMVFISDGEPTSYNKGLSDTGKPIDARYSDAEKRNMKKYTESAIDDFRALYPDLEIYTIGIGEFDLDYLNRLSYPNEATGTTDFRKILEQLNSVITCGVGRYSNLKVTDTLSDYVNFADDFDLKIQIVPKTAGRETIVLYENGALTTEGRKYIKSDGVKVSTRNKTVTVDFLDDFYEEGGFRYSISYNVKATEKAYSEYAENLAAGKDGYDDVLGHVDTDYLVNNNKTSSLKGGFHANKSAILEYTQTRPDGTSIDTTAEYPHPVVQVSGEELHVEKVWYDGSAKHGSDSVTVQLWITDGSGEPVSKINEATLNSANDWSAGFTDLPKSYTYTVIESKCPHGYAPIYSYEEDTSTWTITNVPAKADITLQKNGQGGTALKVSGVEFELYSDEALTELVGTYTTDANGVAALDDLTVGETYWIVETVAPSGYRRMSEARSFTVTWTDGKAALEVPFDDAYLTTDEDTVLYVRNYSGYELPESGGMGTALFTALGAALALAPLVFLAARKRRRGMAEQ